MEVDAGRQIRVAVAVETDLVETGSVDLASEIGQFSVKLGNSETGWNSSMGRCPVGASSSVESWDGETLAGRADSAVRNLR